MYAEQLERVDMKRHPTKGTLSYKMKRTWVYQPHLSVGSLDDNITTVNFPIMVKIVCIG